MTQHTNGRFPWERDKKFALPVSADFTANEDFAGAIRLPKAIQTDGR